MLKKISKLENYYKAIFFLFLLILTFKFLTYEHYPTHDEIVSVNTLSSIKTSFVKFQNHNHLLSTWLGNIIIYTFGLDLMKIRLVSFLSFLLMSWVVQILFKDYMKTFLFLLICISINVIITYYSLYRGYAISSLLFSYIFFLIHNKKSYSRNLKKIYIILSVLVFHNQSTLFLVIPILIVLTFDLLKPRTEDYLNRLKLPIFYFFTPFVILSIIFSFIEGVSLSKIFIELIKIQEQIPQILNNIIFILYSGFKGIFFNDFTNVTLLNSFPSFIQKVENHYLLFTIFVIALIKSIYHIFIDKKNNLIDYIIFIFFICFILINRNGPARIYIGFISFFIIYILRDFNLNYYKENLKFNLIATHIIIVLIFFKLVGIEFVKIDNYKIKYLSIYNNMNDCSFPSQINLLEFEKHLTYFTYLEKCKLKPDINRFYKFYKA
jgi:hypothetical protein